MAKMDSKFFLITILPFVFTVGGAAVAVWAAIDSKKEADYEKERADSLQSKHTQLLESNNSKADLIIRDLSNQLALSEEFLKQQQAAGEQLVSQLKHTKDVLANTETSLELAKITVEDIKRSLNPLKNVQFTGTISFDMNDPKYYTNLQDESFYMKDVAAELRAEVEARNKKPDSGDNLPAVIFERYGPRAVHVSIDVYREKPADWFSSFFKADATFSFWINDRIHDNVKVKAGLYQAVIAEPMLRGANIMERPTSINSGEDFKGAYITVSLGHYGKAILNRFVLQYGEQFTQVLVVKPEYLVEFIDEPTSKMWVFKIPK